jgi:uncharacterized protein YjdB/tRNA A-37 threonylcarbamoyl transferase component Bud32
MPTLRNCVKCGEHIVLGDRFCAHCGAEQPATLGGGLTEAHSSRWDDIEKRLKAATEGRYHIRGLIGRGGMAAVYLADWPQMDLRVAIKVMDPYLLDQETFVQRFLQEARTIAKLKHRHIIRVYDSGQFGDLYYFCMDYFPGRSLEKVLSEEGPLPFPVVKLWLSQAADALGYAHRQPKPIVHRDVKPSNILLDSEGDLVITDFGIAKVRDVDRTLSSPSLTMPGAVLGTPTYLSPEQASLILNPQKALGGGQATGASDQYALGVVAYEMLVGSPPFSGDLGPLLLAHAGEDPPPILDRRPDCPRDLAEAVMRMLEKAPDDRWPSMHHVYAKLSAPSPPPGDPLRLQLMGYARGYKAVGSVSLSPPSGEIFEGQSFRLAATPLDLAGQPLRDRPLSWMSSDPNVALVTEEGQVTVLRSGPVSITATADGVSGEVRLEVAPVRVDTVVVLPSQLSLAMGEEGALRTLLFSGDGKELEGREVEWSSSDGGVAEVSAEGTVTALRLGRAVVTATSQGRSGTVTVEVIPVPVASVELSPPSLALEVGEVSVFRCSVRDAMGRALEERSTNWTSDDPSVVDLSGGGRVVGLRPGQTTVTVECGGVSGTGLVTVSPEKVASLRISPDPVELMEGDRVQLAAVPYGAREAELADRPIVWETGSPEVAEVDEVGILWGIRPGQATIIARCEGKEASVGVSVAEAPVLSLDLLPAQVTLAVGDSLRLHAIPKGRDGRELGPRPVAWVSSDESTVSVDDDGLVRAVEEGEASVAARCQGREASARVLVRPAPVASLEVPESSVILELGESRTLLPVARGSGGQVLEGRALLWSSSSPDVAEVDGAGRVRALAVGTTLVTVGCEGVEATVSATVAPERVVAVEVSPSACELEEGEEARLTASPRGKTGMVLSDRKVEWSSEDPSVVRVSGDGSLRGLSPGSIKVTARCGDHHATCRVTVNPAAVGSLDIGPTHLSLVEGESGSLSATVRSERERELAGRSISWASTEPEIAQVSHDGRVQALAAGRGTITATCEGKSASASVLVTLEDVASLKVDPGSATLGVGESLRVGCQVLGTSGRRLERHVRWRSETPEVASVTGEGEVEGLTSGRATITAECEGHRASLSVTIAPPPVAAVRITPEAPFLFPGDFLQLEAVMEDARGGRLSGRSVSWSSSNPKVARVGEDGRVEALDSGAVRISAKSEDRRAEVMVEVKALPVASVEVVSPGPGLRVKRRRQLEAVVLGTDGRPLKGRKVLWETSDPTVAEVDPATGRVRGLGEGTVGVTARCEGVEGHGTLTVEAPAGVPLPWLAGVGGVAILAAALGIWRLASPGGETVPHQESPVPVDVVDEMARASVAVVALSADRETVTVNEEIQLEALALDDQGVRLEDRAVEWRTSDPAVASVTALGNMGALTARRAGTAVITATVDGVSGTLQVVVQGPAAGPPPTPSPVPTPPAATAIRIDPTQGEMDVGTTRQLRVLDQGGSPVAATYRSSDAAVATISAQGVLRTVGPGTVTVTASHSGLTAQARFQVRAAVVPERAPTLGEATLDSLRANLGQISARASMAEYEAAYRILDQVGARLGELKIRFPVAPALLELEAAYLQEFRATYGRCDWDRRTMLERGQPNPPTCRPPPTGGGDEPI